VLSDGLKTALRYAELNPDYASIWKLTPSLVPIWWRDTGYGKGSVDCDSDDGVACTRTGGDGVWKYSSSGGLVYSDTVRALGVAAFSQRQFVGGFSSTNVLRYDNGVPSSSIASGHSFVVQRRADASYLWVCYTSSGQVHIEKLDHSGSSQWDNGYSALTWRGCCIDVSGNAYLSLSNLDVRKLSPSGSESWLTTVSADYDYVSTAADSGDCYAIAAKIVSYVPRLQSDCIIRFDSSTGSVSDVWVASETASAPPGGIASPRFTSIWVDGSSIYCSSGGITVGGVTGCLHKFSTAGVLITAFNPAVGLAAGQCVTDSEGNVFLSTDRVLAT
jgi:hypothetical protein